MRRLVAVLAGVALLAPVAHLATAAPAWDAERWALVIGVSDYAGRTHDTVGGAGDAHDVREALVRSGWPADHVLMLVDGAATASAARDGMRWLVERSHERSFSVFHFSGHVKQRNGDPDGDGEALDEFLWFHDNQLVSDREFAESMRRLRGDAWINVSGCEAAGFDEGVGSPRRLFTASSQEPEKSYERPDWRNSVFTGLLVDQGILEGRADANGDRRVSLHEAFARAAELAPQMTARQRHGPQHPYLAGGDGTEWFLDPPPPPPPAGGGNGPGCAPVCVPPLPSLPSLPSAPSLPAPSG
jgi:hypothetical protein